MILFNQDDITISTLEREDKNDVIALFQNNNFTSDNESRALKPSIEQLNEIMDLIANGDDENNILVLKKNGEFVGYCSIFVEFSNLNIGHMAIKEEEQHKGYGKLLVEIAIQLAINDERKVVLFCDRKDNIFKKMGFCTNDSIHYDLMTCDKTKNDLPKLFVSKQEYITRIKKSSRKNLNAMNYFCNLLMKRTCSD